METKLTLRLDLILDNQGLAFVINLLGEFRRDGVVGSRVLHDETLVSVDALKDRGFLNGPFTDVGPVLFRLGVILLRMGWCPPRFPVIGELLEEGSFQGGRLGAVSKPRRDGAHKHRGITYGESRLLYDRGSFGVLLSLLSMSIAHESGRRNQSGGNSCVETHDEL